MPKVHIIYTSRISESEKTARSLVSNIARPGCRIRSLDMGDLRVKDLDRIDRCLAVIGATKDPDILTHYASFLEQLEECSYELSHLLFAVLHSDGDDFSQMGTRFGAALSVRGAQRILSDFDGSHGSDHSYKHWVGSLKASLEYFNHTAA